MSPRKKTSTAPRTRTGKEKEPTFEEALESLEDIVARLEEGEVTLEESLEAYRRGKELVRLCLTRLEHAEAVILKLSDDDDLSPDPGDERDHGEEDPSRLPF